MTVGDRKEFLINKSFGKDELAMISSKAGAGL